MAFAQPVRFASSVAPSGPCARELLEQAQRPVDGGERGSLGSRHGREDSAFRRDRHLFIIPERGDQDTSA